MKESYYQTHRNMVKDIILGFAELFKEANLTTKQMEWILRRFTKNQWRYIKKLEDGRNES